MYFCLCFPEAWYFCLGIKDRQQESKGSIIRKNEKTQKKKKKQGILLKWKKAERFHFEPHCVESTKPENLISYTNVEVDGNVLENVEDYTTDRDIQFKVGQDYTDVDGIVTFRGNSFRDNPDARMCKYDQLLSSTDCGLQIQVLFLRCSASLDRKRLDRTATYDEMA